MWIVIVVAAVRLLYFDDLNGVSVGLNSPLAVGRLVDAAVADYRGALTAFDQNFAAS